MEVEDVQSINEITQALVRTGSSASRITNHWDNSDRVTAPHASIAPLNLIHPLIRSTSLYPMSACKILSESATMMQLYQQVQPFLDWIMGRTRSPTASINALTGVDLAYSTLQARKDIFKFLVPPPPMTPMYIYTRYMPNQHVIVDPPSTLKPPTELAERWGG